MTIAQPEATLAGAITSQANVNCNGSASGSFIVEGSGGTAPYVYSFDGGQFQSSGSFTGLVADSYTVTVRDASMCTKDVTVVITQPDELTFTHTEEPVTCPDDKNGSITLTISGGTEPYTTRWYDGILTRDRNSLGAGTYNVIVTDLNGCAKSADISITVTGSRNCIIVPEIITPNDDLVNDTWQIKNIDLFPNAEVLVYNRWGELVFKTKNLSANPWDGTSNGKALPTDSYHYILYLHDGTDPKSGVISIIR